MNIAKNFLINRDKPDLWKSDISKSVDLYNSWFMKFAPKAFRETRLITIGRVESTLKLTNYLSNISHNLLKEHPEILQILRMSTCPPIARDRLIGLARVSKTLIASMEDKSNPHIPTKILIEKIDNDLILICNVIKEMIDPDIFVWLDRPKKPAKVEIKRAATIVADRLCGALSDPIIRNAQETRQLDAIKEWLQVHDYLYIKKVKYNQMEPGTFCFRANIPILRSNRGNKVNINIPIDVLIMPKNAVKGDFPLLIEAKSAGDFTNVNKRRKEEAQKLSQLKANYGDKVIFGLFLCGYFDSSFLGYEAAEGIDWVWEHRIDDLALFGL